MAQRWAGIRRQDAPRLEESLSTVRDRNHIEGQFISRMMAAMIVARLAGMGKELPMLSPIDAVFEGYGFDENGEWHRGSILDLWRWNFSDLGDGEVKGSVAELIAKVLLHAEPETMTESDFQLLRFSYLSLAPRFPEADYALQYDA